MVDFSNMYIEKLIVHRVFKRGDSGELIQPEYSLNPIILDDSKKRLIIERLVTALGRNSKSLMMNIVDSTEGSTIQLISKLYNCTNQVFTQISKEITYKLALVQTISRISDCALFIVTGSIGQNNLPFSCIVKSESQSAFRLIENSDHEKILELIDDALLGKDQKLFKIGFIANIDKNIEDFEVIVFDSNLDQFKSAKAAKYFYIDFLGCAIQENSATATKDFYNETSNFINSNNYSTLKKIYIQNQLVSYLLAEGTNVINSNEFANNAFRDSNDIDNYLTFMDQANVTSRNIFKDLSLLNKKLKKRYINFTSGIRISGDFENFEKLLKFDINDSGSITVEIQGEMINQS